MTMSFFFKLYYNFLHKKSVVKSKIEVCYYEIFSWIIGIFLYTGEFYIYLLIISNIY